MNTKARFEPAFPVTDTVIDGRSFEPDYMGMSLRDYFAAKALMGLLAEPISEVVQSTAAYMAAPLADDQPGDLMARAAYRLADAMIKAREA